MRRTAKNGGTISINRAVSMIEQSNGKFIRVTFFKRTTGEKRSMVCRTTNGSSDVMHHNLIRVVEVNVPERSRYRNINLDTVDQIVIRGTRYDIK